MILVGVLFRCNGEIGESNDLNLLPPPDLNVFLDDSSLHVALGCDSINMMKYW